MDNQNYQNAVDSSTGWYRNAVIGLTVCLGVLGIYTVYNVFTTDIEWGFKINWNCFKSPFFPMLAVIGFFLQFFDWQHTSMETWIGRKGPHDSDYKWEKSNDIMDSLFGGCLWPLLSHLLIIPCVYGAIMWYAIMGLLHILGKLSPFFITALAATVVFFFYKWANGFSGHKYRVAMLVGLTVVSAAVLGGTAYYMKNPGSMATASNAPKLNYIGTCQITGNGVNLRHGPGTEYDKLGVTVSSGESYPLLEEADGWVKIDYKGSSAWLSSKFCEIQYPVTEGEGMDDDDPGCWTGDEEEEPTAVEPVQEGESREQTQTLREESETQPGTVIEAEVESSAATEGVESAAPASVQPRDDNNVHASVEEQAEFVGGMPALMRWLSSNIRYPESAQKNDVQGRVIVKFIVEKDGSITNAQVIRSVDSDLDREALRVVGKMPKWTPGRNGGVPVRSYFTLPVNFRLQEQ